MNVAEQKSHDTLQELIDAFDREDPTFDVLEWMERARQTIALLITSPPYTVVDLGHGKWEVAAGTSAKIPCIAIGINGTGRVGEIVTAEPRQMSVEETFVVITFANIDGLEVLQEKLNEVRKDHFADIPAPAWAQKPTTPQEVGLTDAWLLEQFKYHPNWELSTSNDLECDPSVFWLVHEVKGGRNDREWFLIGEGDIPRNAIIAALRAKEGK